MKIAIKRTSARDVLLNEDASCRIFLNTVRTDDRRVYRIGGHNAGDVVRYGIIAFGETLGRKYYDTKLLINGSLKIFRPKMIVFFKKRINIEPDG